MTVQEARRQLQERIDAKHGGSAQLAADALRVSRPLVSMWLSGDRTPSMETAIRIQDRYGIPADAWSASHRRALALYRRSLTQP